MTTDVNEIEIVEGARVESLYPDNEGALGTVEVFDPSGWPDVVFDGQPGEVFTCMPSRLQVVRDGE